MDSNTLPLPLAAQLAIQIQPQKDENGASMGATADDEVNGLNTYTDDFV